MFFGFPGVVGSVAGREPNPGTDVGDASGFVGSVGPDTIFVTTSGFADGIACGIDEGASAVDPDRISDAINRSCSLGLDVRA